MNRSYALAKSISKQIISYSKLSVLSNSTFSSISSVINYLKIPPLLHPGQNQLYKLSIRSKSREKRVLNTINKLQKRLTLKRIEIKPVMTIKELSESLSKNCNVIIDCLNGINYATDIKKNDSFEIRNVDVIKKVVKLCGYDYKLPKLDSNESYDEKLLELEENDDSISKRPRPSNKDLIRRHPVVTIMGHVDHGKTTLLDSLRGTNVVAKEFGGITQHIGAFNCRLNSGDKNDTKRNITFLDTPGHAAFSIMRSRGAKVTDIVVLVVAAEDGVMAQTVESIEHAKKSGCPIIVAINKIDKVTDKQIEKTKRDLLSHNLVPEDMGGDIQVVPISALKKINLEKLKEEIWARAEIMGDKELLGDPKGLVEGYIIESTLDQKKGKLATILIQRGTLKKGDFLIAGEAWCKVKYIFDENSNNLSQASLSQAVQIMGWKDLPNSGDEVLQVSTEQHAKDIIQTRKKKIALNKLLQDSKLINEKRTEHQSIHLNSVKKKILDQLKSPRLKSKPEILQLDKETQNETPAEEKEQQNLIKKQSVAIILKADVNGSLEAILNVLDTYDSLKNDVDLNLINFEVGIIKPSDIELAELFNAIIYCFNLPEQKIENKKIQIRHFNVIYKMFDDLLIELNKLTSTYEAQEEIGSAEVLKLFDYKDENKNIVQVIGGKCLDGILDKKLFFKLIRNNTEIIGEDEECLSLKHLKTEVSSIKKNVEFGLSFNNQKLSPKVGDKIICYKKKQVKRKIEWNLGF